MGQPVALQTSSLPRTHPDWHVFGPSRPALSSVPWERARRQEGAKDPHLCFPKVVPQMTLLSPHSL